MQRHVMEQVVRPMITAQHWKEMKFVYLTKDSIKAFLFYAYGLSIRVDRRKKAEAMGT